ncbi:hypothetical protein T439DRAFT_376192 [Meredithblackwellia eburnea MCA 4105]
MTTYTAQLSEKEGFHPHLVINWSSPPSATTSCSLFAHIPNLPTSFILDRFQLLQLHEEGRLGYHSVGEDSDGIKISGSRDLEGPVSKIEDHEEGDLLLRLTGPDSRGILGQGEVRIPLHMRYQVPVQKRSDGEMVLVNMSWPVLFYGCPSEEELPPPSLSLLHCPTSAFPTLPFPTSSVHLLLPPSPPEAEGDELIPILCPPQLLLPTLSLSLPTGVTSDLSFIEPINFAVVWLGAFWCAWKAFKKVRSSEPSKRE